MKVKTLNERADIQTEVVRPSLSRPPPAVVRPSSGGRPGSSNRNGNWTGDGELENIARDFHWGDPYS